MATKKTTTGDATEMRRCIGSARFGIEPHEAAVSEFPEQLSRKDGLGLMCAPHWKAYVKGLREARASQPRTEREQPAATKDTRRAAKATTKRERRRSPMVHKPPANAAEVAKAEALIAEVDALPGPEMVARVGDDDVQAALETVANGRVDGEQDATGTEADAHGTVTGELIGETIDGGRGEADAA